MIQTPAGSSQATRAPTLVIRVRGTATCRTVTYSASGSVRGGDATPHRRTPSATRRAIGSALALALIGIASACSAHHAKPNPTAGASPSAKIAAEANRNHVTVDINKGEIVRVTIPPLYQNDGQVTLYNVDPPGSNVVAQYQCSRLLPRHGPGKRNDPRATGAAVCDAKPVTDQRLRHPAGRHRTAHDHR